MIYLDDAAIEQPKKEVIDAVTDILYNHWFNPNSVNYDQGIETRKLIDHAKNIIANELNCNESDLIFTSCGSESNTTALMGIMKKYKYDYFITSESEHSSITENPYAKFEITMTSDGRYDLNSIGKIKNSLVAISMANSETGVIQDIKKIVSILHSNGNMVHVDAVACLGKEKINIADIEPDTLTVSAQKIGGILGCSVLYKSKDIDLEPLIYGHNGLRSGTPNVPAIVAMGKAVELIDWGAEEVLREKRDYLIDLLLLIDGITLNGSKEYRLPNNINICFHNTELYNQQIVSLLNMIGNVCCSSGSACNIGTKSPSKALLALGMSENDVNHSIRITLPCDITYSELDEFITIVRQCVNL